MTRPLALDFSGDLFFKFRATAFFLDHHGGKPVSDYRDVRDLIGMLLALKAANLLQDLLCEIFGDLIEFFHLDLVRKIFLPCRKFFYVNLDGHFKRFLVGLEAVVL